MTKHRICATATGLPKPQSSITSLLQEWLAKHKILSAQSPDNNDPYYERVYEEASAIEKRILNTKATSLEDLAAKIMTDSGDGVFQIDHKIIEECREILGGVSLHPPQPLQGPEKPFQLTTAMPHLKAQSTELANTMEELCSAFVSDSWTISLHRSDTNGKLECYGEFTGHEGDRENRRQCSKVDLTIFG